MNRKEERYSGRVQPRQIESSMHLLGSNEQDAEYAGRQAVKCEPTELAALENVEEKLDGKISGYKRNHRAEEKLENPVMDDPDLDHFFRFEKRCSTDRR